jgi:hypothetical protein
MFVGEERRRGPSARRTLQTIDKLVDHHEIAVVGGEFLMTAAQQML